MRNSNDYCRPWPGGFGGAMHFDLDLHFQGQTANFRKSTRNVRGYIFRD
jgi:hypothetical protein